MKSEDSVSHVFKKDSATHDPDFLQKSERSGLKTIGEIIELSAGYLKIPRSKRIAEEIIAHVLKMKRLDLYLQFDQPVIESELIQIRAMLKRCVKHEPLEYVIGHLDFFGCQICVDSRVLIPRPETEILVEKIAEVAKQGTLWDLCCGSGCIGIALKKANPDLQVTLSDISKEALCVARENAKNNGVEVSILQGDFLEPFEGSRADFIVCNPPYVTEEEYEQLDRSVRDFEPKLALVGGLTFYERLAKNLNLYLNPGGKIFLEIGSTQKEALMQIFPEAKIEPDWAGLPRFLVLDFS